MTQLRGMTKLTKNRYYFSADEETRYKINEGAFLRLELAIEPLESTKTSKLPSHPSDTNTPHKAAYRAGAGEEKPYSSNSLVVSEEESTQLVVPSMASQQSELDSSCSIAAADIYIYQQDEVVSHISDASASLSAPSTVAFSVDMFNATELDKKLSQSQHSDHDGDLTQYSSSLHSVFTTNHPQKPFAQQLMGLVLCQPDPICECLDKDLYIDEETTLASLNSV